MKKEIFILFGTLFMFIMLSCSTNKKLYKLNDDEILYLIKVDSFASNIS